LRVLLDTHAMIWTLMDDRRLGPNARRHIEASDRRDLLISDMTLLETAMLLRRGRVTVKLSDRAFLENAAAKFVVIPISAAIAVDAMSLDLPQGDPFDRVIAATARHEKCLLLTRDQALADAPYIRTAW